MLNASIPNIIPMFKSVTAICWYWDPKLKYFESSLVNTIVVKIVILAVASDTSIGAVYLHLNKTPKLSFEIDARKFLSFLK